MRVKFPSGLNYFSEKIPTRYELYQNYPNPFNPETTIPFALPKETEVSIKVYNLHGKLVSEIFKGKKSAGNFTINWDAGQYSSGTYFIRMKAGNFIHIKKCILLK